MTLSEAEKKQYKAGQNKMNSRIRHQKPYRQTTRNAQHGKNKESRHISSHWKGIWARKID